MFEFLETLRSRFARSTNRGRRSRGRRVRAAFECLESRSLLAQAPVGDAWQIDVGQLPKPEYDEISLLPVMPVGPGALPVYPAIPYVPPPNIEPVLPPPPAWAPDSGDLGGFMEIGDPETLVQPGVSVEPAADKVTREVLQMLATLRYVPHPASVEMERPMELPPMSKISEVPDAAEGGMVLLARDAVVVQSLAKRSEERVEIDSLLSAPARMDSAYGKFQIFDVSMDEDAPQSTAPASAGPSRNREATIVPPPTTQFETESESAAENLDPSGPASDIVPAVGESILDEALTAAAPPEADDRRGSSAVNAAAAALLFAFAARAARTEDATSEDDCERPAVSCARHRHARRKTV